MWPTNTRPLGVRRTRVATLAVLTTFGFFAIAGATPAFAQTADPSFSVRLVQQEIHGYGWEQGIEVTAEVDDPSNGVGVDWSDTQLALPPEWDPSTSFVQFRPFIDDFVVEPGHQVTLTQVAGATTYVRETVVTSLTVTEIDEAADTVSGTGVPGTEVGVDLWDESAGANRTVVVQTDGTWTADFSVDTELFDIAPGTGGEANQRDNDGDSTQWSIRVPDPAFSVETPHSVWSFNDGWVPGRTVTITVDDNEDPLDGHLYQTTTVIESWGPSPWEAGWNLQTGFTILPGHYVRIDDGVDVDKMLRVTDLLITSVDTTADMISGTAPAGTDVEVHACSEFDCENVIATADGTGAWNADFTLDIQTEFGGAAQIFDDDGDSTHRGWQLQPPYFGVDVANEEMWATNWTAGDTLTFQVFADATMTDLLWTDTMTVFGTPWQNTEAGYRFWGDFDVQGGQYFTVTDGITTKELVVSSLSITDVDPFDDFYSGTVDPTIPADVETEVCAWARGLTADPNEGVELCALPDPGTGEWTIDFTGVGDIIPGDHLGVYQRDADDDQTHHSWGVPPWIYVELAEQDEVGNDLYPDRVHLDQWIGPVDIFLDGVEVMSGVVTNGGYLRVDLDVDIGQTIRVVDGQNDKELLIELLTVDTVTAWDDPVQPSTAFGTAGIPDTDQRQVQVTATADYGWWTERWVPVTAGQYQADFANPGNGWRESEIGYFGEGGADDVYLGGEVRAHLWDFDNDQVHAIWHTCNPRIIIVRSNDRIEAVCFPEGSQLVVELDDPAFAGIEWTSGDPVIVTRNPEKPWETLVVFELGDYQAPPAAVVTATATDDEGTPLVVVTTEVIAFTVDEPIDVDNDRVTGTAPVGAEVLVEADGQWRHPIADGDGFWVADFGVPGEGQAQQETVDIGPGSQGGATLIDENGSATTIAWRVSNAQFQVSHEWDALWMNDFAPDTPLTITVDDGTGPIAVPGGPYVTGSAGNLEIGFDPASLDLQPGHTVTVTDGLVTKSHTITDLTVTGADELADTVSGIAAPLSDVDVWVHETDAWRHVVADGSGSWTADFAVPGDESGEATVADLQPGSNGNSGQCDGDGDCTNAGWHITNPTFSVEAPYWIWSSNEDWELGDTITLTIDDPDFPSPMTTTVEQNDEHIGWGFDLNGVFEIEPGHVVTVTDGEYTKTLTVADLIVELVDPNAGTITGWLLDDVGDPIPDTPVEVDVDNEYGHSHRTAITAANGYWVADFSVPGEGEGEESDPFEIVPGTGFAAQVYDGNWDSTHRGGCFDCDDTQYIDPIDLEPGDVLISETDGTLWVYDLDDESLEAHPLPFGGVWDIQFVWQNTLFIANTGDGRIWVLDLPSGELGPLDDPLFGQPFGMTIESDSAVGWSPVALWGADGASGVLRFDDGGAVQIVDMPGVDGIVVAPDGAVYFTDLSGRLFVVDETQPDNYRLVADIEGYSLNGIIMLPDGTVLATSMGPAALIVIDPGTGDYEVHDYPELWSPEDSALGRTGEIYVIDSGFETQFGDQSGLYVRNADGTLTQLVSHQDYPEFGDTVDVLVVGPTVTVTKTASQTEVFAPDGDLIEYTVEIVNLLGPFGQVTFDDVTDSMYGDLFGLDTCEPADGLASGERYTCSYEVHIAGESGEFTNELAVVWTDERGDSSESSDSAHVAVVAASVAIDKTIGSAATEPGDGNIVAPGETLTWSFVVANDGDTNLVDLVVDDVFGLVCEIEELASGESETCTLEAIAEPGEHADVATVTATAVDADGDTMSVEASDGSSYVGLDHVYVTDSSLCVMDGFDLVFTPDMKNWPGHYKLSASNPGQFYWNGFVTTDELATITIEVPYPFVTQGAMPLHDYAGVAVGDGSCFIPLGDGAGHPATFDLGDYADTNGDGVIGFGDVHLVEIEVSAGFHYLNLHLDHGLEGSNGWIGGDADAFNDPAVNPDLAGTDLLDETEHAFTIWVDGTRFDGSVTTITNHNEFKNVKGFGGLVVAADATPVAGVHLQLRSADGTPIETMTTDAHGWYLSTYWHRGPTAEYQIVLLDPAGGDLESVTVTVGRSVKFGLADFTL